MPDPTTDFFLAHKSQCQEIADALTKLSAPQSVIDEFTKAVGKCDAAIAGGSLRTSQPAVVGDMAAILTKYNSLSTLQKTALSTELSKKYPVKP